MKMGNKAAKPLCFLARLRADQSGNIIALTAAAILPVIAIVGASIDISRLYAVKTRMQSACDVGALAGRKVMGSGAWDTDAENAANSMFSANFASDFFGVTNLSRVFTGNSSVVNGTISADVPMTLMQVFDKGAERVTVNCTSEMKIPHTDVMFVLDVTGSMNCAPLDTLDGAGGTTPCTNNGGTEKSNSRMRGLRTSVNCFYETLAKADTGEVCDPVNGDPTPTGLAAGIQLRVGFMPYSSNVNVGYLLPTAYFDGTRVFSSRSPIMSTVPLWADNGAETMGGYGGWSPATRPNTTVYTTASNFPTWTSTTGSGTTTVSRIGGSSNNRNNVVTPSPNNSAGCNARNSIDSNRLYEVGDVAGTPGSDSLGAYTNPTYPGLTRTRTRTQPVTNTVTGYRYAWISSQCRLQYAAGKTSSQDTRWNQTRTRTGTQPVHWPTTTQELTGWTMQPRSIDVSGLKNGTNWNTTVSVPDLGVTTANVTNRSGTTGVTSMNVPAPVDVTWTGCIEERQTYLNIDDNPDDEWNPIHADAIDMDIDRAPDGTAGTKWGPALQGIIYNRTTNNNVNGPRTTLPTTTTNITGNLNKLNTLTCPDEAKKLQTWTDPTAIRTYTTGLTPTGGTYHDIGLLWGARFISPTGIFGNANSTDSSGNPITIQRHIVFMTDGDTGTCSSAYTPYGISWWDRRQTNKADPNDDGVFSCSNSYTNRITDARTAAICTAIKNMNITLWVVSFSNGVSATTNTRLGTCASSPTHFKDANSTADLLRAFQEIALEISRLRLQS